jgi:hypothetical protein
MSRANRLRLAGVCAGFVGAAAVTAAAPGEARASFHLMKVREIYAGSLADPNVQYVELQMYSGGQNFVGGHSVLVFSANGRQVGTFMFQDGLGSGANQSTILIGTAEAETFFDVTMDLVMTPAIVASGGKVCFDATIDCVAWGTWTGGTTGVGTR